MTLFLYALLGVVDTITLPKPALAIAALADGRLAYLASTGDELCIQAQGTGWRIASLPDQFSLVQRVLMNDELCYILRERTLTLYDLRTNRKGVVAQNVDDAAITSYGELWVMSDFTLRRLSALGRELEQRTLSTAPLAIWMIADSLVLVNKGEGLGLLDQWKRESLNLDLTKLALSPDRLAISQEYLYVLLDARRVLRVLRVLCP